MRKSHRHGANLIEATKLVFREADSEGAKIVIELGVRARSDDGNKPLGSDPCDSHLAGSGASLFGSGKDFIENRRFLCRVLVVNDASYRSRGPFGLHGICRSANRRRIPFRKRAASTPAMRRVFFHAMLVKTRLHYGCNITDRR